MPFDYVAINDGGVARLEGGGDMILIFYGRQVLGIMNLDLKTIVLQIAYPITTAASGGGPIYVNNNDLFT
jgi:hypothetical protein